MPQVKQLTRISENDNNMFDSYLFVSQSQLNVVKIVKISFALQWMNDVFY